MGNDDKEYDGDDGYVNDDGDNIACGIFGDSGDGNGVFRDC
jgi:hypothetical protein